MTLYERLGASPGATRTQLRAAYRERMRAAHPDAGGNGDPEALRALSEAWAVLGVAERRADYDRTLVRPKPVSMHRATSARCPAPLPRHRLARLTLAMLAVVFGLNVTVLVLTATR